MLDTNNTHNTEKIYFVYALQDVEVLTWPSAKMTHDSPDSSINQQYHGQLLHQRAEHVTRDRDDSVRSLSLSRATHRRKQTNAHAHSDAEEKPVSVLCAVMLLCACWLWRGVRCRRLWLLANCKNPRLSARPVACRSLKLLDM